MLFHCLCSLYFTKSTSKKHKLHSSSNYTPARKARHHLKHVAKGPCKQGNIAAEAKMRPGRKKCLWKISKFFCFQDADFVSSTYVAWGLQTRNHLGNTEETLTLNVFRMFPRLRTQATYLEDAEFASQKKKCFTSFPCAHL